MRLGPVEIALGDGQNPCAEHRPPPHVERRGVAGRQHPLQQGPFFVVRTLDVPEGPDRPRELECPVDILRRFQPDQRRAEIALLRRQPGEPGPVNTARRVPVRLLAEGDRIPGMRQTDRPLLSARGESLQSKLANRLQHREPRLVRPLPALHQTLIDKRRQDVQNGGGQGDRGTGQRISRLFPCPLPCPPTASAASSVKPPTKTARRRKIICSSSVSRSWLQSMAACIVWRRSGWSRAPWTRRGNRRSSRASIASGDKRGDRAAANSIASGNPSSRRQMAVTEAALAFERVNDGLAASARDTKSWTAGD